MGSYELNKRRKIARQKGFIINRRNNLTTKFYSHLSTINKCCYLKFPIPICHRHFFKVLSQNSKFVQTLCNDLNNLFLFASGKWYLEKHSPPKLYVTL